MGLFSKKRVSVPVVLYEPDRHRAVLKCSICTGEQVAGFKDVHTGHFTEVMFVRNDQDLKAFKEKYNLSEIHKEY